MLTPSRLWVCVETKQQLIINFFHQHNFHLSNKLFNILQTCVKQIWLLQTNIYIRRNKPWMTQMTNEIAVIFHLSILEFVLSSYAGYLCTHSVIVAKKDGCRNYKRGIFIFSIWLICWQTIYCYQVIKLLNVTEGAISLPLLNI